MTGYLETLGPDLIANGFHILPILPGTKKPIETRWPEIHADSDMLRSWIDTGKGHWGVGILGEQTPGIDIDTTDATVLQKVIDWGTANGLRSAPQRIGRAPRTLLVCRADAPFGKFKSRKFRSPDGEEHQIEILGDGAQFVAHAIHPDTKQPYLWPEGDLTSTHADLLPQLTEQKARDLVAYFESIVPPEWKPVSSSAGDANSDHKSNPAKTAALSLVGSAMSCIPNDDVDYHDWIRVAHALKAASAAHDTDGCELFHEWSTKASKYDFDETQRVWDAMKGVRHLGAGTIFHLAGLNGWKRPNVDPAEDFDSVDAVVEAADDKKAPASSGDVKPEKKNRLLSALVSIGEAETRLGQSKREPLIEGILHRGTLVTMIGPQKSGKTFNILDICAHIASGRPWCGREVAKGVTLHIICEGEGGVDGRLSALRRAKQVPANTPQYVIPMRVDLFNSADDVKAIAEVAAELRKRHEEPLQLIAIDTLARVMPGGDENTTKDLTKVIGHVDQIREATGAAVMVAHHTGWHDKTRSRGGTALPGAIDGEMLLRDGKIVFQNMRDFEEPAPIPYRLESMFAGNDAHGRDVFSAVVRYKDEGEFEAMPLIGVAEQFFQVLLSQHEKTAEPVRKEDWENAYRRSFDPEWSEGADNPKGCSGQNLRKLRAEIVESGHAKQIGERYEPITRDGVVA
jgi:hypothetical protein